LVVADPGSAVSVTFRAGEADLVRMRMGPYSLYAFSGNSWLQDVAPDPDLDVAAILAPQAKIVDFTGYYLCGPANPAYKGTSAGLPGSGVTDVSWDEQQAEFLPSAAGDWRSWPWPRGAEPFILGIHGSPAGSAFSGPDMSGLAAPWAVGSWIAGLAGLKLAVRPLADPIVLMSCGAARSGQVLADATGRLVWAPTGGISVGGEPVSLADASAGARARVSLDRAQDGRPGRFRSFYPQGPAGDRVRHAYRERFGKAGIRWLAEQFVRPGATAPGTLRPRLITGHGRFSGWSFYDERDWNSRRAAFGPARIGSSYVTWAPGGTYQPGTPRHLDPRTGKIAALAEPWHVTAPATLPFDAGDVLFAAGYFARGQFLVAGENEDLTYLESPLEFGRRLRREHEAATAAGLAGGRVLPRRVVLLTDHEPVPPRAARLVARALDAEVITASRPATLFLDDHPAAGIPDTRVALLPGSTGTPAWTRTTPAGVTTTLTTPPAPDRRVPRQAEPGVPVPGSRPAVLPAPGLAGPRGLAQAGQALEAGTGLGPQAFRPGTPAAASVLTVRRAATVDFVSPRSPGELAAELDALRPGGAFPELLEINGDHSPGPPARGGPVTGQPAHSPAPVLTGSRRALPAGAAGNPLAADNPLIVLADYYGGYFLLAVTPGSGQAVTTRAESPRDLGRRIRAELLPAGRGPGQPPAVPRPVVLLARHRPVPPQVAAALAEELKDASSGLYTASMPATAYARTQDGTAAAAALALVRFPGHADEPYWTLTTPAGLTSRISAPPLRQDVTRTQDAEATAQDTAGGEDARSGQAAEAGTAGPVIRGPAMRLRGGADPEPDIIRKWKRMSRAGNLGRRSDALKRVDDAVEAVAADPGSVDRLQDVLTAIRAWQQTKTRPSIRQTAIQQLRQHIENNLDNLAIPAAEPAGGPSTTAAAHPAAEPADGPSTTAAAHPAAEPADGPSADGREDARAVTASTSRDRIGGDQQLVPALLRDNAPPSGTPYLDAVEAELRKVSPGLEGSVWERTYGNALDAMPEDPASWILQVPDAWGWSPEDAGSGRIENPGIRTFLAKIKANIAKAEYSVDITGFGIPGFTMSPFGEFPDGPFTEAIGDGLKTAAASAAVAGRRLKVRVLIGVVKADVTVSPWAFRDRLKQMIGPDSGAVDINVAAMTTRGFTSYNHTKFLVVDGMYVIHGGINWMKNYYIENGPPGRKGYGGIAPVTDLNMALSGPAATSAGKFLDLMWTWTIKNASTRRWLGVGAWLATNNDTLEEAIPDLYSDLSRAPAGNLQVISVGSLGYGIQKNDPMSEYQPPPAESIDQAASSYWRWGWKSNNETNSDRDFMTVNPDANALRALIATATKKIVLCQMDINGYVRFPLNHALFDVRLFDVLAAKMTAEPPVKVQIVISNPDATGNYSNIGDIKVAIITLFSRVRLQTASDADAQRAMDRNLQLAPLRVSDQATWPGGHKYRLHTKVVSVDDKAFYIGSRNVYPDTTQDHGFIIEDAAAARQLSAAFLDKLWKYSRKAAIFDWEQTPEPADSVTTDPTRDNATPAVDRWLADRIERAAPPAVPPLAR
jgi:phosphatidylserine/phosphatidylglycerophosphate/cardiolipin synthase-like enzyme